MKKNALKIAIVAIVLAAVLSSPIAQAAVTVNITTTGGYAGYNQPVRDANSLIYKLYDLSNAAFWVLISLAMLYIVWNVVQFIKESDSTERAAKRATIMWGIVGLAVILSIWGLVAILGNTFGLGNYYSAGQSSNDLSHTILAPQ